MVEVSLPEMEEVRVAHVICILSEMRDFLQPDFNKHFQEMVSSSSLEQGQELSKWHVSVTEASMTNHLLDDY